MKHKKHFITLVCLVIGMLVFTSAVYANYDDAKGYSNYKKALKYLAFEANNYTAKYDTAITIDGEKTHSDISTYKCADGNNSQYTKSFSTYDGQNHEFESYSYVNGKMSYNYYPKENMYYQSEVYKEGNGSLMGTNDATAKKAYRFAELLADTLIGDLKNNVILTSSENGINKYAINVSGNQIPEIVNAGLSLLFTANNSENNADEEMAMFGNEPYIDNVIFKVTLDKEGRLIENEIEASLVGNDKNGKKHKGVMKGNILIFNYGTTTVDVFNPEGKTKGN
ncbi:MAG: hypothetical protein ACOX4P_05330 [Anaerovoracaceae bacterium]|jgi:hypothetical protein